MTNEPETNTQNNTDIPIKKDNKIYEPQEFGMRLLASVIILSFIFCLAFITVLFNTDMIEKKLQQISQDFYAKAQEFGFVLDDVVVLGRDKTSKHELLEILNLQRGDNFLKIDVHLLQEKLKKLPWVKSVTVKRKFYPNVIEVTLTEKQVRSIWQINEKFYPIDEEGHVINASFVPKEPLLLIIGEGAPENINQLLKEISFNKKILERVKVANFISKRRWNLVLDDIQNGITIKLPEKNVEKAWKKLVHLDTINGILKRKLTIIDLRLEGKITVKLKKTDGKPPLLNHKKENLG